VAGYSRRTPPEEASRQSQWWWAVVSMAALATQWKTEELRPPALRLELEQQSYQEPSLCAEGSDTAAPEASWS